MLVGALCAVCGFRRFVFAGVNIQLISFGSSKVNLTLCVDDSEAHRAVQAIHDALFCAPLSLDSSTRSVSPV